MRIFFIIFLIVPIAVFAQKRTLKNGDLIFQNLECGPMCDAINAVTEGYNGKDFNHMGLVVVDNDNYFVIESLGKGVRKVKLQDFLDYTQLPMYLGRLKQEYQHLIPKAIEFATEQIGLPYDNDFLYDNGKYYCSELIYDAFFYANQKKPFFQLSPMTYKQPGSKEYFPVWTAHFRQQGMEVPEGKPGCNPAEMSLDEKLDIILLDSIKIKN